jgi:hypothetical protein
MPKYVPPLKIPPSEKVLKRERKKAIINLWKKDYSYSQIGKICACSRSYAFKVVKVYRSNHKKKS